MGKGLKLYQRKSKVISIQGKGQGKCRVLTLLRKNLPERKKIHQEVKPTFHNRRRIISLKKYQSLMFKKIAKHVRIVNSNDIYFDL